MYFDDLEATALTGGVHLSHRAFTALWSLCDQRGMRVLADVHTHPGPGVGQSPTDADNPLVARVGHVALIVPNLAIGRVLVTDIGVHRYGGDDGWDSSYDDAAADLVHVGWLP